MAAIESDTEFVAGLIDANLLTCGEFTATSDGTVNPYYLDLRAIYSYPDLFHYAVEWLRTAVTGTEFDYLCGIETASLPLVADGMVAYDSLAEACMTAGDNARAIELYEKSLAINPGNTNAVAMLKKLRGES